ncbi:MAG: phosphate/phosphite/phosphonate ABC transporter substrate-binding protein [Nitrospirae bacterium]|nr:MAG: phosphate/phosphite/phosphonate ABC transporter substrate-binding protein [Nitrospirota bacterium]
MGALEKRIIGTIVAIVATGSLIASLIIIYLQKRDLYDTATEKLIETSLVISKSIERTMLEGKAEVTKAMVSDLRRLSSVEDIEVLNYKGLEAFNPSSEIDESNTISRFNQSLTPYVTIREGTLRIYRPLENGPACQRCHHEQSPFLGVVKISLSLKKEQQRLKSMLSLSIVITVLAVVAVVVTLALLIRRMIIKPINRIKNATKRLSMGDLSQNLSIRGGDEIALVSQSLQEAIYSISSILQRVKDITRRVSRVASEVENDSREVVEGTKKEAEAIEVISSSIQELNSSISEIAESTESLAVSSEQTSTAIEEMSSSIAEIAKNTNFLSESVDSTSSSIEQLSSSIRQVAGHAEELLSAADETLATLEQITRSVKNVEESTRESAELSQKVMEEATTFGMDAIKKTIEGMDRIRVSVETTAEYIRRLGSRSEDIGKILTVIDDITDQTTLLALNAAILAAQAGEHGKGFSVVADEIKDLAERTSFSTHEISTLIQNVQKEVREAIEAMEVGLKAVEEGMHLAGEASEALTKIAESSKRSYEMAVTIDRSTAEQTEAARFVTEQMERVRDMSKQIARAMQEQKKGMQLIMKATEQIRDISAQVKTATEEQSQQSRMIRESTETVAENSQQIANAIYEQKEGSQQINNSLLNIIDLPQKNRQLSFKLNNSLRALLKDAELIFTEMERFILPSTVKAEDIERFGVVPLKSPAEMHRMFKPLSEYLSERLKKKVELKVAVDFNTAIKDIGTGNTTICYMSPSTYIKAHMQYGVRVVLKALRDGKGYHHSVIFTRADSDITRIEDLKGRSFAFGDPESTSSHIVPRYMLKEAGVELDDLLFYNYLGHHDDVVKAVLNGQYDAGAVMESVAEDYKDRGLKIIKYSEEIPEFNICVTKDFPSEELSRLIDAFVSLNENDPVGLGVLKAIDPHYTGFVEASDEDYAFVKEMMIKLELL